VLKPVTRVLDLARSAFSKCFITPAVAGSGIRECEEHGWMKDCGDPDARERALAAVRQDPPSGVSPDEAAAAVEDVLGSIGDMCPECPPDL
jgi:hypothetical protein